MWSNVNVYFFIERFVEGSKVQVQQYSLTALEPLLFCTSDTIVKTFPIN